MVYGPDADSLQGISIAEALPTDNQALVYDIVQNEYIPTTVASVGGVIFQDNWNASTNTPDLTTSPPAAGKFWYVQVAGNTDLGGITDWGIGDWAVSKGGGAWIKIDNTDSVVSVNAQQGVVILDTDDIAEGTVNLYYTEARVNVNTNVAANTTHCTSDGTDHTYINQDVGSAATPTFVGVALSGMTEAQRDAIVDPAAGLVIYDTDDGKLNVRTATEWRGVVTTPVDTLTPGGVVFAIDSHHIDDDPTRLFWDNTLKKLIIGTGVSSTEQLDVAGYVRAERFILNRPGESQSSYIQRGSAGVGKGIGFYTVGSQRMIIREGGNVGIGLIPTNSMAGLSIEAGRLTLKETNTPAADANYGKIYCKSNNNLYFQDGAGTEHQIAYV